MLSTTQGGHVVQSDIQAGSISNKSLWTGRILSGLAVAFMLFDATIHIMKPAAVIDGFTKLGFPVSVAVPLGIIELVCVVLYVIPRTSVFGAILLTGYLGGAIASQVRIGSPMLSTTLFPIYVALFLWGGLYFRDERVRSLIPVNR
jgi:hypothetical protein